MGGLDYFTFLLVLFHSNSYIRLQWCKIIKERTRDYSHSPTGNIKRFDFIQYTECIISVKHVIFHQNLSLHYRLDILVLQSRQQRNFIVPERIKKLKNLHDLGKSHTGTRITTALMMAVALPKICYPYHIFCFNVVWPQ